MRPSDTATITRDRSPVRAPFEFRGDIGSAPVLATAIHAGHDVRPEVERELAIDEPDRRREEDPYTDHLIAPLDAQMVVHRSRFEVDLNRAREDAVYSDDDDTWGLDVWRRPLPDPVRRRSLDIHDAFYAELAERLDRLAERGRFVVFDVHSYNHRRRGPQAPPEPAASCPDVNVGTASLPRHPWRPVVDRFIESLSATEVAGRPLDVRENVRFCGAHLAHWVHDRYPGTGCALALEFKKTFMDEWTGEVDEPHLRELTSALERAVPAVTDAVEVVEAAQAGRR